jgi:RecB family endonuclease NucS
MKLIIIGTDHELQDCDVCLKDLVASLTESEQVTLIGEEHRPSSISVARHVAQSKGVPWVQIDMNTEERLKAGIEAKLLNRMQIRYEADGTVTPRLRYAPKEDGMREEFWLDRIAERQTGGTALVVCGALHARKVSEKARQKGHDTKLVFHPEIPGSQLWVSIMPELF